MQYRLRTLLIVLALGPPMLACVIPPLVDWLTPKPRITTTLYPSSIASQLYIEMPELPPSRSGQPILTEP